MAAECVPVHLFIAFAWMLHVNIRMFTEKSPLWARVALCSYFAIALLFIIYMMVSVWIVFSKMLGIAPRVAQTLL
jgi:hypothetical protein